jgi:hypothetical protein
VYRLGRCRNLFPTPPPLIKNSSRLVLMFLVGLSPNAPGHLGSRFGRRGAVGRANVNESNRKLAENNFYADHIQNIFFFECRGPMSREVALWGDTHGTLGRRIWHFGETRVALWGDDS